MVDAGVPLATAINSLAEQSRTPELREMLTQIEQHVQAGDDLSAALARFPKSFDQTYVNLIKASEASGTLGQMLIRIADQAATEQETQRKVKGAVAYPGVMWLLCVGMCVFLLTYVFPKLTPMFAARKMELPLPTQIMVFASTVLTHYWYLVVLAAGLQVMFLLWMRKQTWGRKIFDWLWINLPIIGPLMRKVTLGRSLRTLATTINAGVPVLEAIHLCAGVTRNIYYEKSWKVVGDQVTGGKQIHEALKGNKLFPPTLLQMISSGESTGKLGHILNKVGDHYEREIASAIKSATSLIEPIMVTAMGGAIGGIALAMLLPIFKLSQMH